MKYSFNISLLFFIYFFATGAFAQFDEKTVLADLRENIPTAFKEEKVSNELFNKYKSVENPPSILKGYIGGLYISQSRFVSLFNKVGVLKTGTKMLDESIVEKPNNLELLFLRLTIQLNLPSFLGYNDNVDSDKFFVLNNYNSAPPTLKKRIINFTKTSGFFSETEIAKVSVSPEP